MSTESQQAFEEGVLLRTRHIVGSTSDKCGISSVRKQHQPFTRFRGIQVENQEPRQGIHLVTINIIFDEREYNVRHYT